MIGPHVHNIEVICVAIQSLETSLDRLSARSVAATRVTLHNDERSARRLLMPPKIKSSAAMMRENYTVCAVYLAMPVNSPQFGLRTDHQYEHSLLRSVFTSRRFATASVKWPQAGRVRMAPLMLQQWPTDWIR